MKKLLVVAALAACTVGAETIDVPAGQTVKVEAGRRFTGASLVKTGAGTLDLSGAVLANAGLVVQAGAVRFQGGASAAPVTARYLKFNVKAARPAKNGPPEYANSGSQFSEFRIFKDGKMLPLPAGTHAMNGSPDWREGPDKGLDGDLKTKCYFNPLTIDFGREVTFDGYSFATANDAIGRDPYTWTLSAGFADGSSIDWLDISTVEKYEAPHARNADIGKVFPVSLKDLVPPHYAVTVCGTGRLVLSGLNETLENVSGNGLIVLENASLDVGTEAMFAGSVVGGAVSFKRK